MIEKDKLKSYANKLMFDMEDSEYETLKVEFKTMVKQMEIIENIEGISNVEPMTFPFLLDEVQVREDNHPTSIDVEDALSNCHDKKGREVRVPRVVE